MMTIRERRLILILSVIAFLVVVPVVLFYTSGYRLNSKFQLIKTGGLYVSSPVSGSQIFINQKLEKETNIIQGGLFMQSLKPGAYHVLIAKDGYWPWAKELEVKERYVAEARALLLPREPEGELLTKEKSSSLEKTQYDEILALLKKAGSLSSTTTEVAILENHDRQRILWKPQKNEVWAEWLKDDPLPYYFEDEKVLVIRSQFNIRNADFYPGRNDVLIIAVQNGVFAIEIDGRGGRILQPIYKGKEPIFATYKNESAVYILDEDALIKIRLP